MREEVENVLNSLQAVHSVSKNFNHIVEYKKGSWMTFEPSKFIYSWFTFNSIYSYDWRFTINEEKVKTFDVSSITEREKFSGLLNFIFSNWDNEIKKDYLQKWIESPFSEKEIDMASLGAIITDPGITQRRKESFIDEIDYLLRSQEIDEDNFLDNVVVFIYNVRNNIFHGRKSTLTMMDEYQKKRLLLYSHIINGLNDSFFKVIKNMDYELNLPRSFNN